MNYRKSTNRNTLKQIMHYLRRDELPPETDFIILYSFLYKYCSDHTKSSLLFELKSKKISISEAYRSGIFQSEISLDLLKLNGFFIKKPEAFIEEVVNANYLKPGFLQEFLRVFPEFTIFNSEYHNMQYFDHLFKITDEIIHRFKFDSQANKNLCEIIYLISKLNVMEDDLGFDEVFSILSSSRYISTESNPEYITQVLSEIILTEKKTVNSVYDPFMKDGKSITQLNDRLKNGLKYCYGKDVNELNFLYSMAKFFMKGFSFNNVFLKHEDALDSVDINGASFDVIISRVPIAIKNYYSSNVKQNMEIAKRNKRSELENILLNNFGMDGDSFKQDNELNQALENLVEKIDFNDSAMEFKGQYESLRDSEFLFLINLVEALNQDGIMAISISENFLFKDSLEILRRYLTLEKNYIDAIIRIPNEFIRSRPEVVIVFRKDRSREDILFIDMSSEYDTQKNAYTFPGLFRNSLVLDENTISKMRNVFLNRIAMPKYSNLISMDEIEDNDFNLSVSRYVDTFEGEFVSLEDLASQKQDIDLNLRKLNLKIKKMMDELDIRF
ncbi:N-6 DNA methylase [Methanobrevibacter sp.]|uniref:N-6 DNA methylase n=1 Tax=Methanobrevibacter sp. TaxID=66852 RepID=UPI00386C0395